MNDNGMRYLFPLVEIVVGIPRLRLASVEQEKEVAPSAIKDPNAP